MKLFSKYMIPSCCHATSVAVERDEEVSAGDGRHSIKQFSSSEISALVTNPKCSTLIAEGGFSTVHLATLPGSRSHQAAFKVHQTSQRLYCMFHQELDVLRHVDHPNIVRLLGYSDDGDQTGVLVLEHVPSGTLHDMLRGKVLVLSWSQRVSIALQLATALEYLHEGCDLQIIHGDVKASNVLLDQDLNPKLCDFGFARMGFSATVTRSANRMMGSPGYADPHYLRTGLVSKKSDVYSFGVLILELITGMEAFSTERSERLATALRPWLEEIGRGATAAGAVADRRLEGVFDEDEVRIMAGIAAKCVGGNPNLRPSMTEVVRIMREEVTMAISAAGLMTK